MASDRRAKIPATRAPVQIPEGGVIRVPHHGGPSVIYDDPLHHATAYFGFDAQKERFTNYFLVDGITDETQINAAIAYVNALGGGLVFGERGLYDIDTSINVLDDVTLQGTGPGTTIGTSNNITMITGTTKSNVRLLDFRLTGTGEANNWAVDLITCSRCEIRGLILDTLSYGIMLHTCTECSVLENTLVSGIGLAGIWIDGSSYLLVQSNHITGCGNGIEVRGCLSCDISDNEVHDCTADGLYFYGSVTGCQCSGNVSEGNVGYGIHHHAGLVSYGVIIEGNKCQGNTLHGFGARQLQDSVIEGNVFYQNGRHGIFLHVSCDNNAISGNVCSGNDSGDSGTYDGICIEEDCQGNLVHGNICKDNDRWGIMIDNNADFNKVSDNYTSGNTAGSINVNGATCDKNQVELNTVEEGAPVNTGTATRAYGNYDPSADAFVGNVGAAPW